MPSIDTRIVNGAAWAAAQQLMASSNRPASFFKVGFMVQGSRHKKSGRRRGVVRFWESNYRLNNDGLVFVANAGADRADGVDGLAGRFQLGDGGGSVFFRHDDGHADAAVEHAVHFSVGAAAVLSQPGK